MSVERKHWIIRVGDGKNFKKGKYPIWGMKRCHLAIIKKIKKGDILWFSTKKSDGGKIISMAEFTDYYDRKDEPLIPIHTISNEDQDWVGDQPWDIQIHFNNLYNTERQNIYACIQCGAAIMEYETFIDRINDDLYKHYENYKFYAEPIYINNY